MLNLNSIIIGSSQPRILADFYEKVFGRPSEMPQMEDSENNEWFGWLVGSSFLSIGPHSEVEGNSKEPQRIMFNLSTEEVKKEYDRLVNLGAVSIKEPYEMGGSWIATLADPDGNYFQLVTPWEPQ
jgi:predicted enzyme related to lactoylglutathione lyase